MDPKRRKTQDFADSTNSKAEPMELNIAEAGQISRYLRVVEKGTSSSLFFGQNSSLKQQLVQRRHGQGGENKDNPLKRVKELNRKKDIVCLILSYPPMTSANKERHKNWFRDVLKINHKVREMERFSSEEKNRSLTEVSSETTMLLKHSLNDIEAYVPPMIIERMCEKTRKVTQPDVNLCNLAVNFATRQILGEIENPEILILRISGKDAIKVLSAVKDLPQIRKRFNIVIQVDGSSYPNIKGIEEDIAAQLGFSSNIWVLNKFLKNKSFLIILYDIYERVDLYEMGSKWWNSRKIQKIVCTTRYQEDHQRMAVDLVIRLDDHLLSWELFSWNVGKVVKSSCFQHRANDVVEKCSGHLLAVVLMARALKMAVSTSIWEHASYILSLPIGSHMEDRVLCRALAFVLERLGSAAECVKHCAFYMKREGMNKVDLILEWIKCALISTFDEGEKIVQNLVNAFLLETSQDGSSVQMRDEIHEVLVNSRFLLLCGKGLTKAPKDETWAEASEIHLMNNRFSLLPNSPNCPQLCTLFLQKNPFLRVLPPNFFLHMPMLQILDLSHTKIRSLPQSLYGLAQLQRLFLRGCELLMELPPEVGKLSNLKVLDLEGTEIIRLPVEVGRLTNLTCLKMAFHGDNDKRTDNQYSNRLIPQRVMSNLVSLKEVIIDVNRGDKRWNANVKEIVEEMCSLDQLEALQLYLPEVVLFNDLIERSSINLSGMRFSFTVGSHLKPIISRLPLEAAVKFEEQERRLKYVNGKGVPTKIGEVLELATAFFLDRHSATSSLSEFGFENMRNLRVCVLGECDEIQTITDAADDDVGDLVFESLEYLDFHYMKNLRSIWKGPLRWGSLSHLKALVLCTCPQLTTIFTLNNAVILHNLEVLVVEDCPEIESILVTHDPDGSEPMLWTRHLFPKLRRISLHYMPKLVSIFNGLRISPILEWMSLYDCPSLKTLSTKEVSSNDLKVIIGEAEWWRDLEWDVSKWSEPPNLDAIFVPIEQYTDLTTRLAEINDQLQAQQIQEIELSP